MNDSLVNITAPADAQSEHFSVLLIIALGVVFFIAVICLKFAVMAVLYYIVTSIAEAETVDARTK